METIIRQYVHRPNTTELGLGNTHETYMLVNSNIDLTNMFPPSIEVEIEDTITHKLYTLKSASGREFRVNQMGQIYRDYNVKPGDEIQITQIEKSGLSKLYLFVSNYNRVVLSVDNKGVELSNEDSLKEFSDNENRCYKLTVYDRGISSELIIKFKGSKKKRNDSPNETDFFDATLNDVPLTSGTHYLTISDKSTLTYLPKCSFNETKFDDNLMNIPIFEKKQMKFPLQQIYYGAPGTGKSFTIDNLTDDDNSVRTTFHPDTDYASFVGAYKPTMKDMPLSAFVGKEVHRAQPQGEHPGTEQRIVYKYVPQAFLKAYVAAWSKLDTPYYLIIEEINRGNCAQIFGDLFQLLDRNNSGSSSYAINADEDIAKFLKEDVNGFATLSQEQRDAIAAYELVKDNGESRAIGGKILDGTLLLLPHNLHIWATMNTSDQSLFPIDSAFKRRWNWKYVPINTNPIDKRTQKPLDWKIDVAGFLYSWGKFLEKINPEIYSLTESSDKQMGYFFVKADPSTGYISEEVFLNKVLFYLWTDVFKDYDVSSEIFKNKKENRSFRFTDFFEDAEALANFIDNCGLDIVDINIDSIVDEDETTESSSSRDYTRYSINDNGKYSKRQLVLQSLRSYVEANHTMTSAEIIEKWETVNPNIQHFILSESQYENRIKEAPSSLERYFPVELDSGEKIYITNQWNKVTISEFIKLINKSDFGFQIKEVNK